MASTDDNRVWMAHSKAKHKLAMALLHAGESASAVSQQLEVSLRTVQRWRMEAPELAPDAPQEPGELSPALTLASIAVDGKMPAGARVTAAKALLEMAPVSVASEPEECEMSEFERFECSLMAGWCYAELLAEGRHSLNEAQLSELDVLLDDLHEVLMQRDGRRARTNCPPTPGVISADVRLDEHGGSSP